MQGRNTDYIERLDHLRFAAASLVVLFHTWLLTGGSSHGGYPIPLIDQGHVGVQLFMVISGFILAVISHGKDIDPVRFYRNRVLRIYPLFVFVLALGYFATPDPRPAATTGDFLIALLPISNLSRMSYGEFGGQLWSIGVELQFYLLFPLFHSLLRRRGPSYHLGLIALLIFLRAAVFRINGTVEDLSYYSIFGALDAFLVGQLCGWLFREGRIRLENPLWLVGSFALLNILVWRAFRGEFYLVGSPASPSALWIIWPDLLAAIFAVMIPAYIQCRIRIPLSTLWNACGRYSYSIYLWHILVIALFARLHPVNTPYMLGGIVLSGTTAFAAVSYHVIELPFLQRRVVYAKSVIVEQTQLAAAE